MHQEDLQSLICQQNPLLSLHAQHKSQSSSDVKPLGIKVTDLMYTVVPLFIYLNPAFPEL